MTFKIGDRVRIKKDSQYYGEDQWRNPADEIGIITDIRLGKWIDDCSNNLHEVDWKDNYNNYGENDIELAQIPNTKLARKLNPNHRLTEDGKYLIKE